jgi:hypothetical protein
MKPVGQKHLMVDGKKVDKDVVLFKNWFQLQAHASTMSPVKITLTVNAASRVNLIK